MVNITVQNSKLKTQSQVQSSKPELRYRAFYFSLDVIKFLEQLEYRQATKIISNQLIRAATSIGANIVEAKSSSSKREFLNYFQIALKSAQETRYWLALLKELLPNRKEEIDRLSQEAEALCKIISASVLTMKGKRS